MLKRNLLLPVRARMFSTKLSASDIACMNSDDFRSLISDKKLTYMVYDEISNKFECSHDGLYNLSESFMNKDNNTSSLELNGLVRDFDEHEGIFIGLGKTTNAIMSGTLHKTKRGPGAGGVRYWKYNNVSQYICDGLRLSRGMGRKNALAGLWWGGGKGVIWRENNHNWNDREFRNKLFKDYGEFISMLNGCYITAEDLGVNVDDMEQIFSQTRYTTCIPQKYGGSGNPGILTAKGIIVAMEAAVEYKTGKSLKDVSISLHGFGNVGQNMVRYVLKNYDKYPIKRIYGTDLNRNNVEQASIIKSEYSNSNIDINIEHVTDINDISALTADVDIVSPNAVGGILNKDTINKMKCKYIVGAANNQLLNDVIDDELLYDNNICYVPDFLCNRMGIVNCSNEQYGRIINDYEIEKHFDREYDNSIFKMTHKVLELSKKDKIPTGIAANIIADELIKELHPIWGHRSSKIVRSILDNI